MFSQSSEVCIRNIRPSASQNKVLPTHQTSNFLYASFSSLKVEAVLIPLFSKTQSLRDVVMTSFLLIFCNSAYDESI